MQIQAARSPWQIQRSVVFALLLREVKGRFGGRLIGGFWVLFEPLVHLGLMTFFMTTIAGRVLPGVDYPVFMVSGMMQFFLFRNLSLRLMVAVDSNRGLFAFRQVKPLDALISRALLEVGLNAILYLMMLAVLGWLGYQYLPSQPLQFMASWLLTALFGMAVGLNLAMLNNRLPQAGVVVRIVFLLMYFSSGVVIPLHAIPADYFALLLYNPLVSLLELSRSYYFPLYQLISGVNWAYPFFCMLTASLLGLSLYRRDHERLLVIE